MGPKIKFDERNRLRNLKLVESYETQRKKCNTILNNKDTAAL